MKYIPQVDDYVRWKTMRVVYFKCDQSISIELGVKDKVCHEHGASFHKEHIYLYVPTFNGKNLSMSRTGGRTMLMSTNHNSIDTRIRE